MIAIISSWWICWVGDVSNLYRI